jgi:DNA-binding NarL/FixJ family response regulator
MKIVIADDSPRVCSALRFLLEQEEGYTLQAEVHDSDMLLDTLDDCCPDIILLDWEFPGLPAAELVAVLQSYCPETAVIGMSSQPEAARESIAAGAHGFINKGNSPSDVLYQITKIK